MIFVLAAGKQVRFPSDCGPKQLLPINGESTLVRTIRLVGNLTVVTHKKEIQEVSPVWIEPECNKTVLHTIHSTKKYWEAQNIFLLGDVFYSEEVVSEIIAHEGPIKFWVSGSEIFGFSFNDADFVYHALKNAMKKREAKIWHLYRRLHGLRMNHHVLLENESTRMVTDYTFDVDSLTQYNDVCEYVKKIVT